MFHLVCRTTLTDKYGADMSCDIGPGPLHIAIVCGYSCQDRGRIKSDVNTALSDNICLPDDHFLTFCLKLTFLGYLCTVRLIIYCDMD